MGGKGFGVGLGALAVGDVCAFAVVDVRDAEGLLVRDVVDDVGEAGDFAALAVEVEDCGVAAMTAVDFVFVREVWGWDEGAEEARGDLAVGSEGGAEGGDDAGLGGVAGRQVAGLRASVMVVGPA
jgi:hypothetical protein